ncbi:MAG: hypothetical protein GY904_33625, partial [Planctomycetaceae bacterium]|nr:hypothetical protein [Planctomycetaceae bacterium]
MIMERVADAAEEVELAGKRGDFEAVASTFITLRHHVEEMLQAIERFANENQAP